MIRKLLFERHIVKRALPCNLNIKQGYLFDKEVERNIPDIFANIYKNVYVDYNEYIWTNFSLITDSYVFREYLYNYSKISIFKHFVKEFFLRTIKINNALYLIDGWSIGYFHWFCDVLQRYFLLETFSDYTVILSYRYKEIEYVRESLEMLGIKYCFIKPKEKVKVKKLVTIAYSLIPGNYIEIIMQKINQIFLERIKSVKTNNRIYITRRGSNRRKVINEEQFVDILNKYNFTLFDFDKLCWKEQVEICRNANCIFSMHGAALTNMLFMKKKSTVIEIRHPNSIEQNCYFSLASALNFKYYYIVGKTESNNKPHTDNLAVDLIKLEECLKKI